MEFKFEIDTNSDEFKEQMRNSILKSDAFQEKVTEILESDEIKDLIAKQIKYLLSNDIKYVIEQKIKNYIDEDFDIEDFDEITEELVSVVKKIIKTRIRSNDC